MHESKVKDSNIIFAHPTFHFYFAVPSVYLVWKGLFVENIMSIIFEFFYSKNFTPLSVSSFFITFQPFFSQLSVRFVVCLQAKKSTRFIFTTEQQKFPTRFCGKAAKQRLNP